MYQKLFYGKLFVLLMSVICLLFLSFLFTPSASAQNERDNDWVAWTNDVGWLHMGTINEFKRERSRSSETWGGNSSEPLVKTKILGPFSSREQTLKAIDEAITELTEQYKALARPNYVLVGKIGGKDYYLGKEITLDRAPLITFGEMYLVHLSRTYTTSGPVDKDAYILHGEPPQDGKIRTADGYGGTFTHEAELVGGPFDTNFKLCPVLKTVNLEGISLPGGRFISCKNFRPDDGSEEADTDDVDTEEHEDTGPATLKVRAWIEDEDEQFTPADEARLHLEISNVSPSNVNVTNLGATLTFAGIAGDKELLRFTTGTGTNKSFHVYKLLLKPGNVWSFSETIRSVGETNKWIFDTLIAGNDDARKPSPEKSFALKDALRIKITGRVYTAESLREGFHTTPDPNMGAEEKEFFNDTVSIKQNQQVLHIIYPDMSPFTGTPPGHPAQLEYYRMGDPGYSSPGNKYIRFVALRAARYGGVTESMMPQSGNRDGALADKGELDPNGPLFPERQKLDLIFDNVVSYIHQSLMPKKADNPLLRDYSIAQWMISGSVGPDPSITRPGVKFICQTHAFLFGSVMRALGFPVREINVIKNIYPIIYRKKYQDASNEVWFFNQWNYVGLFSKKPFYDHVEKYSTWFYNYELYYGCLRNSSREFPNRFSMSKVKMDEAKFWEYGGYGTGGDTFTELESPHFFREQAFLWLYSWFSPVVATIELPNGQRVGAFRPIDPQAFEDFVNGLGPKPEGLQLEMEGAFYFPEGFQTNPDAADTTKREPLPQTIVIKGNSSAERNNHRIILNGIASGEYTMKIELIKPDGKVVRFEDVQGEIAFGDQKLIEGALLQPNEEFTIEDSDDRDPFDQDQEKEDDIDEVGDDGDSDIDEKQSWDAAHQPDENSENEQTGADKPISSWDSTTN